jgi:ATP-binding cassette, subfamily F, member 3
LAVALQDYEGAVILVSHDRHLLRVVADEFLLVDQGSLTAFDGDLEDYARWLSGKVPLPAPAGAPAAPTPRESADNRKARKRADAEFRSALAPLRTRIAESERELTRLLGERSRIERELAAPAADTDRGRLVRLAQDRVALAKRVSEVEGAWLEASEQLETRIAQQQDVD